MKKIMFNDKYGLTQAVLEGRKTMTRRVITGCKSDTLPYGGIDGTKHFVVSTNDGVFQSTYKLGEIVSIAQPYKDIIARVSSRWNPHSHDWMREEKGWNNKMFVRADIMPHHIRITDIKVERLQDISDEECLKEGIYRWREMKDCRTDASEFEKNLYGYYGSWDSAVTPKKAFEYMIDRISGKGTWERNPWVFAYSFELID